MFRTERPVLCLVVLAAALALVGCADPTKGKPAAEVAEPVAEAPPAHGAGETAVFAIGEGSRIDWVGSKVTGQHDGGFGSFEGEIRVVNGDPAQSVVRIVIDTTSLWSDNERLTGHLKSPDFFEVETYPTATFESTSIAREGEGFLVTGNLDLHGVEKSITFPAEITLGPEGVQARAEFSIKRFDFGIVYPGKTDDLIRDDVLIRFELHGAPAVDVAS